MADEPEDRTAKFKVVVPEDPRTSDQLTLFLEYRNVRVRVDWRDSEQDDLIDLMGRADWFLQRSRLEYQVHLGSFEIDSDLGALFPDDLEEEE